jgi:hypothetical protein
MCRWCQNAEVRYNYLVDESCAQIGLQSLAAVHENLKKSKWFTRG